MISLLGNINSPHYIMSFGAKKKHQKANNLAPLKCDTFSPERTPETETAKFIALRDDFYAKVKEQERKCCLAEWEFNIKLSDENAEACTKTEQDRKNLYKNPELYKKFKAINKELLPEREQQHLEIILDNFEEELFPAQGAEELEKKLTEVQQLNQKDTNVKPDKQLIKEFKTLIKMRNKYAQAQGYDNYYDMIIKLSSNATFEQTEKLYEAFENKAGRTVRNLKLQKIKNEPIYFKKPEDIIAIAKETYKSMGVDIDKLVDDGVLTLNLYPRKNKSPLAGCYAVSENDVRISTSITNEVDDFDNLCHELGHSIYELGISKDLPAIEKYSHWALSEAIAMMMGELYMNERILDKMLPPHVVKANKACLKKKIAEDIADSFAVSFFEREIYKNPDQNLDALWEKTQRKYGFETKPKKEFSEHLEHFITVPGSSQNYLRGKFMQAQIYKTLNQKLGKISQNPNTTEFLKEHIFKYGTSISEDEIIEKLTGTPLGVDALVELIT